MQVNSVQDYFIITGLTDDMTGLSQEQSEEVEIYLPPTRALALADAIYLAAGKLPKVEDGAAFAVLKKLALDDEPWTTNDLLECIDYSHVHEACLRLEKYGLVSRKNLVIWHLTDKGREFVEGMRKD